MAQCCVCNDVDIVMPQCGEKSQENEAVNLLIKLQTGNSYNHLSILGEIKAHLFNRKKFRKRPWNLDTGRGCGMDDG